MKPLFKLFLSQPLLGGGLVMIVGSNLTNVINYIYHVAMGRVLTPSDYGVLATLMSLSGLIGILPGSIGLTIVKFISSAKNKNEERELINWFRYSSFFLAIGVFTLIIILSPLIMKFLHLDSYLSLLLLAGTFLFSIPTFFNRSILQGLIRFKEVVGSVLSENIVKLVLGFLFVTIGYSVHGAISAILLASFLGWLITQFFLSKYSGKGNLSIAERSQLLRFTFPVIIYSLATTSLYSLDLILVKHFFSSEDAGVYAALSVLGRIVLFASGPIGAVMFPLVAQRKAKKQEYLSVFYYSFAFTALVSSLILGIYYLWPQYVVSITYTGKYLQAAHYLFWFGLFATFFTLANLLMSFYLSIGRTGCVVIAVLAAIAQVIGILLFHQDLLSIVQVSIFVSLGFLISLGIYPLLFKTVDNS